MTQTEILEDLDYVKTLAEEGRHAPLLGGRIGLWWGCLLIVTLFVHYLALLGKGPLSTEMIGMAWMTFGIVGGIGSAILGRHVVRQPGASSMNNRVASALWTGNVILLFTYAISASFSAGLGYIGFEIMDTMMPIAFGLYGLTAFVLARIGGAKWQLVPGAIAFAFVPISLFLLGKPELYIAAIIAVIGTIIIPGIIHIRDEPKAVV
ncbi:MAG: hypothetical protein V3V15_04110 [Sphingorhabdus sp.]